MLSCEQNDVKISWRRVFYIFPLACKLSSFCSCHIRLSILSLVSQQSDRNREHLEVCVLVDDTALLNDN